MSKSVNLISKNFGNINPESLEDYLNAGGFGSLKRIMAMTKEEIIEVVKESGLKGRGGAAYPTGIKFEQAAQEKAASKVVVCNADEGEPSTFKDRALLENDPFRIIEGMVMTAWTVDADQGFIYIREEYPKLQRRMKRAVEAAEKAGFVGNNILGSGFSFSLKVVSGGGAYVCGEGTALSESIEGKAGRPRNKPPFIKQSGVYSLPTCLNNVETLSIIPLLFSKAGDEYVRLGTPESKGTKMISIAGNVNRPGVYEIPFGLTLREIIYDIGGGIPEGKKFKFAQLGGASGAIASEKLLDVKYTYDDLRSSGLSIGSGAFLVADETNSVVDYMVTVQGFFLHESCGKCAPCREGNRQLVKMMKRFKAGSGASGDLQAMASLSRTMKATSFCGLGKSCTAPLMSALKQFPEEFEECINRK
jgi:NADH-quinone oxidoreductase subunit F